MTAPATLHPTIRLVLDVRVKDDVTVAAWRAAMERALAEIAPLCEGVPVVTTRARTEGSAASVHLDESYIRGLNRLSAISAIARGGPDADAIVAHLTADEPVLSTAQQAEAARMAAEVVSHAAESLCRCTHEYDRHDRIAEGEQRRGACCAHGCRCGIFRASSPAVVRADTRPTRADNDCELDLKTATTRTRAPCDRGVALDVKGRNR